MATDRNQITVGMQGSGEPFRLPLSTVLRHALVTGSSGSGKTGFVLSIIPQLVARNVNVVVADPKGDLAPELREHFLHATTDLRPGVVTQVQAFGPVGVPLNPLARISGLEPEAQACAVALMVAELIDGGLGPRMMNILEKLALAFIEVGGTLADVARALDDDAFRVRIAGRVRSPELRRYLVDTFAGRESEQSKDALRARLDRLLLLPRVRAMLCADGCLSGDDILEGRVTVLDVGGAPPRMASVGRFMGALLYQLITSAVFSRDPAGKRPVVVALDEFQETVKSCEDEVERMLTMARFKKVGCILITQSAAQIPAKLLPVVRTNCIWTAAFRPEKADIVHLDPFLPTTGRRQDPDRPDRLLTEEQERKLLLRELGRLPERHALFADAITGTSRVIRSLTLPYEPIHALSERLTPDERAAWRRGRFGVPFADLARALPDEDDAAAEGNALPSGSTGRRRGPGPKLRIP